MILLYDSVFCDLTQVYIVLPTSFLLVSLLYGQGEGSWIHLPYWGLDLQTACRCFSGKPQPLFSASILWNILSTWASLTMTVTTTTPTHLFKTISIGTPGYMEHTEMWILDWAPQLQGMMIFRTKEITFLIIWGLATKTWSWLTTSASIVAPISATS